MRFAISRFSSDHSMKTSDIIRNNKDLILERWLARVKEEVPEAQTHGYVALRNDVPDLLDDIANNIDKKLPHQDTHESYEHGRLRAAFENYSLAHVIREYRVLMRVILETVDIQGNVSVNDRDEIIHAVTQAIEEACEVFFRDRQDASDQQKQAAEILVAQLQEEGQLRDDFIGTVTHDLRNPLANTLSLVDLLKSRVANDVTIHKLLDAIHTSTNRADALIRNLLDVNLIKSGTPLPIALELCNISEIARASVEDFREHHQANIRIVDEDAPAVIGYCDPEMLRRALDNLISNAVKYGEGEVTVSYQRVEETILKLSVHNEGNTIPENEQDKIFSRHYRVQAQSAQQGWGIGLSLVHGIVKAHQGSISLTSTATEGTTFTALIPIHQQE